MGGISVHGMDKWHHVVVDDNMHKHGKRDVQIFLMNNLDYQWNYQILMKCDLILMGM